MGYPRVFGVAWAFVAHTDSHFDTELLCRFVRAYQEVQPLTIGELWAVAITLRIVLVENLRRLAELIMHSSTARQEANALADRLLGAGGHAAEPASIVLAEREGTALPEAFAVQLVHRLRDQDPRISPALTGSTSISPRRDRRLIRSCTTSTTDRVPASSRCATSSPACA